MISYRVRHETVYSYSAPVAISHNVAHLLPRVTGTQQLNKVELLVEPTPATVRSFDDYFGNPSVFFIIDQPHHRLRVLAESVIEIEPGPPIDLSASPGWESIAESLRFSPDEATLAAYEYVFDSTLIQTSKALAEFARPSFPPGRPLLEGAFDLSRRIHTEFKYDPQATTLATPLHEVLEERHGVCQDFAQVMIGGLRSLGLAARYVSGYIRSRPPGEIAEAERASENGAAAPAPNDDAQASGSVAEGAANAAEDPSQTQSQTRSESQSQAQSQAQPEAQTGDAPAAKDATPEAAARREEPPALVGSDASHAWVSVYCPRFGWVDFDPTNDMVPSDRHVVVAWGRDYDDVSPLQGVTLGGGLQTVQVGVAMRPADEVAAAPGA